METCTMETGLLKKKPCGHPAVTQCLNCERPLCSQHSVANVNDAGKKTGKFLCKECAAAWKDIDKTMGTAAPVPAPVKKPAEKPGEKAAPAAAAPAPAAPAQAKAVPAKPAAAKPAPAAAAPAKPAEPEKPAEKPHDSGMIEFTPTKKP